MSPPSVPGTSRSESTHARLSSATAPYKHLHTTVPVPPKSAQPRASVRQSATSGAEWQHYGPPRDVGGNASHLRERFEHQQAAQVLLVVHAHTLGTGALPHAPPQHRPTGLDGQKRHA